MDCFHLFTTLNNAAMNAGVQVSISSLLFLDLVIFFLSVKIIDIKFFIIIYLIIFIISVAFMVTSPF